MSQLPLRHTTPQQHVAAVRRWLLLSFACISHCDVPPNRCGITILSKNFYTLSRSQLRKKIRIPSIYWQIRNHVFPDTAWYRSDRRTWLDREYIYFIGSETPSFTELEYHIIFCSKNGLTFPTIDRSVWDCSPFNQQLLAICFSWSFIVVILAFLYGFPWRS